MANPNAGIDEIIADTYEGLGFHARAAMMRDNFDPHDGCADAGQTDLLGKILNDVPDSKVKKHDSGCWRTHAACLRDKIFTDLGWE